MAEAVLSNGAVSLSSVVVQQWLKANGGALALVAVGLTVGGITNRVAGLAMIGVGLVWWLGGLVVGVSKQRDPRRKERERQARQIVAAARVVKQDRDDISNYEVDLIEPLNTSIGIEAYTEAEAREKVIPHVVRVLREREERSRQGR